MKIKPVFPLLIALILISAVVVYAWTPKLVVSDPLVRMPGTQPGAVALEDPSCSCHDNGTVPPPTNWQGSMMAQASRDFLFWAGMTVAAQDSIWAVGNPNATDICERCHFPEGWLAGRSDPTNASLMENSDYDGVHCDFCHSMFDPFFETTHDGTREGSDWINYWDEAGNTGPGSGTVAQTAADATYTADAAGASGILLFNGNQFYDLSNSPPITYTESGGGQYFVLVGANKHKRAPFADANNPQRHGAYYSRYHKSKYFCGTCHDVSNPVLANLPYSGTLPLDGTTILTTEANPAYSYFHVERTFSEFMLSDYGLQGGSAGTGPYDPSLFNTSMANNYIARCQDCHLPDVEGTAANGGLDRPSASTEHPNSGQPLHDMTGGNIWVSYVLASTDSKSANYNSANETTLGGDFLTLDLSQGLGIDGDVLLAGVDRAEQQLLQAASIRNVAYSAATGDLSFRVYNHTGHKLISGFPEGRRMFVNIKAYDAEGNLIQEVNPYDASAGTLKGLEGYTYTTTLSPPAALAAHEVYSDPLVYEVHPSSSLTGESETFHMALSTGRYKDNRIPPKGFRIAGATARLAEPVWHGSSDLNYFSEAEYADGYDQIDMTIEPGAYYVEVNLFYQTTSREFIEFLRDEINGDSTTLSSPTPSGETNAYVIQTDSFFGELKGWGDTIWELWTNNMTVPGAAPFLMTQATVGGGTGPGGVGDKDGLSSLEVWLKADAGVTADGSNSVSNWADQSGNGNDAAQATAGAQPLLITNTLNSQPVLRFDGSNDSLSLGDLSSSFPNTATLFVATTISDDLSYNLYTTQNNNTWWSNDGTGQWGLFRTAPVVGYPGAMPSSGSHIFSLVSNRSTYEGSQNGISIGVHSASFAAGTAHQIGAPDDGTAAKYLEGDVAELIIFNGDLNSVQQALVENYLSAKYNVAVASGGLYVGDDTGSGDFDLDVAGIGREADGSNIMGHSAGMTLWNRDFLADAGDYLLFGHNVTSNDNSTADLPTNLDWDATGDQRWLRSWYVSVTDAAGTTSGTVDIIFDFSEAGMGGNPSYGVANYRLLKRADATGQFSDITQTAGATVSIYGDQVVFRGVDVGQLGSNFTLGTVDMSSSPTVIEHSRAGVQDEAVVPPALVWFGLLLAVALTSLTVVSARRRF